MAKYKVEYENGILKYTLEFRGVEFSYSMSEEGEYGMVSDKPCFSCQIENRFNNMEEVLKEVVDVDLLDLNDEDGIFEILETLENYEDEQQ